MDFLTTTTHLHITMWVVGLILFFIAAFSAKKITPVHMTLRLFYILIILSGLALYLEHRDSFGMTYDIKFLFGILIITFMELILVNKGKGKPTKVFWILFGISLLGVLFIGLGGGIGFNFGFLN